MWTATIVEAQICEGNPETTLAYVFGASSCTTITTSDTVFVPAVWGAHHPFMMPGMRLTKVDNLPPEPQSSNC